MPEPSYGTPEDRHDATLPGRQQQQQGLSANSSPNLPPPPTPALKSQTTSAPAPDPHIRHARTPSASSGRAHLALPSSSPRSILQDHTPVSAQAPPVLHPDASRSMLTPSTPASTSSPRFASISTASPAYAAPYKPHDRSLPPVAVTDETIDDAFAAFILYCNPMFAPSSDTTELKKSFRSPPKSDGNSFSTFTLYELIRRFEAKDIKTWTQLALELGVEPPSAEKGQSTQKVQQYTVRLKRWMRAMHIDAFFDYLNRKQHVYFTHIPPPDLPLPDGGRDNVPLEEDLAIRAIDPTFRPKRGRRKIEDDEETDRNGTPTSRKRPYLDTSVSVSGPAQYTSVPSAFVDSGLPLTAQSTKDQEQKYTGSDPWAAASAVTPDTVHTRGGNLLPPSAVSATSATSQNLRWRVQDQTPTTPHPLSAVTPASGVPPDSAFDEPRSAVTPKGRSRRRHGPAVSSAWSSSNATPGGKLRGRPPSNRSVRDGPFVTFPANPHTKEAPVIEIGHTSTPVATPTSGKEEGATTPQDPSVRFASESSSAPSSQAQQPPTRGERLSLQVPQNVGRPVHLVTPPTLMLSGETGDAGVPPPSTLSSSRSTPQRELQLQQQPREYTSDPHRTIVEVGESREVHSYYHAAPHHPHQYAPHPPAPLPHQSQPPLPHPPSATRTVSASAAVPTHHALPVLPPLPSLPPAHHRSHSPAIAPATAPAAPGISAALPTPSSLLPGFTIEDIKRALVADLIRADISGRPRLRSRLHRDEPKLLATALLNRIFYWQPPSPFANVRASFRRSQSQNDQPPRTHTPFSQAHSAFPHASLPNTAEEVARRLAVATMLGISDQLGINTGATPQGRKRIQTRRYRRDNDGYDVPIDLAEEQAEEDRNLGTPGDMPSSDARPIVGGALAFPSTSQSPPEPAVTPGSAGPTSHPASTTLPPASVLPHGTPPGMGVMPPPRESSAAGPTSVPMSAPRDYPIREVFDVSWTLSLGGVDGEFTVKGLALAEALDLHGYTTDGLTSRAVANRPPHMVAAALGSIGEGMEWEAPQSEDLDAWRRRFYELREALVRKEGEVERLREKVLDAVL